MPCKTGGECVPDAFMPEACSKCGSKIVSTARKLGTQASLGSPQGSLRVILLGHGTHHAADGTFQIPEHVTIYFKSGHGSNTLGLDMSVVHDPEHTLRSGQLCRNYRLWPMIGEDHVLPSEKASPYHHAHRGENAYKFRPGNAIWMYSARSGDGPRLSSIIDRIQLLVQPRNTALEIVWLPCREVIASNSVQQSNMQFADGNAPIRQ